MTRAELEKECDLNAEWARKRFIEAGEVYPMFIAYTESKEAMLFLTPWGNEEEKVGILEGLRIMFAVNKVVGYVMMAEIWMKKFDKPKDIDEYEKGGKMPSEYDDKTEGLIVIGATRDGDTAFHSLRINREGGAVTLTEVPEVRMARNIEGRMFDLLKPLAKEPPDNVISFFKDRFKEGRKRE